jgi:ubiquitin carboxyl-terminal hydrolase 48
MWLLTVYFFLLSYDIADEISGQKSDVLPAEEGFRGTLLTSSVSTQLCQDIALSEWVLIPPK